MCVYVWISAYPVDCQPHPPSFSLTGLYLLHLNQLTQMMMMQTERFFCASLRECEECVSLGVSVHKKWSFVMFDGGGRGIGEHLSSNPASSFWRSHLKWAEALKRGGWGGQDFPLILTLLLEEESDGAQRQQTAPLWLYVLGGLRLALCHRNIKNTGHLSQLVGTWQWGYTVYIARL